MPLKRIVPALQGCSGNVLVIPSEEQGFVEVASGHARLASSDKYDAVTTTETGVLIYVWAVDCLPLFLYDPNQHVAAIAHCGWQSICSGIASNTVGVMSQRFGTDPHDIVAAFGPAICQNCFEVGSELVEAFSEHYLPSEMQGFFAQAEDGKWHLSLRKAVTCDLLRAGVVSGKCYDMGICTCESKMHSSYRRDGVQVLDRQMIFGIVLN